MKILILIVVLLIILIILITTLIAIVVYSSPIIKDHISIIFNRKSKFKELGKSSQIRLINQLRESVTYFSQNKIGALITIENNDKIDNLRTDGIIINANISSSLLIAIFNKFSPLHDGAVVIRNNKIYYASTFYKITSKSVSNDYGSRHRAAFGISEQSDATTIVVSEETGHINIFKDSNVYRVNIDDFQENLIKYIGDGNNVE